MSDNGKSLTIYNQQQKIKELESRIIELEKLNLSFAMKEYEFNCNNIGAHVHRKD